MKNKLISALIAFLSVIAIIVFVVAIANSMVFALVSLGAIFIWFGRNVYQAVLESMEDKK